MFFRLLINLVYELSSHSRYFSKSGHALFHFFVITYPNEQDRDIFFNSDLQPTDFDGIKSLSMQNQPNQSGLLYRFCRQQCRSFSCKSFAYQDEGYIRRVSLIGTNDFTPSRLNKQNSNRGNTSERPRNDLRPESQLWNWSHERCVVCDA